MSGDNAGNYLTFELGTEQYGIELVRVREIVAVMDITPLPLAPECVRGIINLRGHVIPVVDLRRRLAMTATKDNAHQCIIVCDVERGGQTRQMSIIVDAVCEVLHIAASEIEDAPGFGPSVLRGIAKAGAGVKLLLNLDEVFQPIS